MEYETLWWTTPLPIPSLKKVTWIYRIRIFQCPLEETADSAGGAAKSMLTYNPNAADC